MGRWYGSGVGSYPGGRTVTWPTDGPSDPPTSLLFDVFALGQAVGRMLNAYMADSPLTPSEYAFYSAIFETESITPSSLAARLGMPLTTVMDHIARLESLGHAARMTDPRDRRATRVVLTATGLAAHRGANQSFERAYASFHGALGGEEAAAARGLSLMREAVEAAIGATQASSATTTSAHTAG